jgi:putative membrane protein
MSAAGQGESRAAVADASRRTRLASERTYLAWLRTSLTALAVAFGAGKIVPAVSGGSQTPYRLVGAGFGVLGVALATYGFLREREVEAALARGEYTPVHPRVTAAITFVATVLGLAIVVLVLVES